jgi:hypothetical protein
MKVHDWVVGVCGVLPRCAIRHPKGVLALAAAVALAAAPGVGRLRLRTDGNALTPPRAPEVLYDKAIRERFGLEDNLVVFIRSRRPEGIFNPTTLQLVRDLTREFARLPGLSHSNLMSLATENGFRFRPGTMALQGLLEPLLETPGELDQLREDLRKIELFTGTLVSKDGQCTAILIGVPAGMDRPTLYREVLDLIAAKRSAQDEIGVTGAPVAESLLGIHILEDLGVPKALLGTGAREDGERTPWAMPASFYEARLLIARRLGLVPVAMVVMMLVLLVSFRNWLATLVPLPGILATLLVVFGGMGWLGVPIYLTIAVMPVLLTATGVSNDLYLFNRYFSLLRSQAGTDHLELLGQTFDQMVSPITSTSLATAVGFLSFGFSPLEPVRAFGLCTGGGVVFGLLCSLTVVPALLGAIPPGWLVSEGRMIKIGASSALAARFGRLGEVVVRWRWWAFGLVLLVTALTPLGLRQLVVQDSWMAGFDPHSEFSCVTREVNEELCGMHLLLVSCEAPRRFQGEVAGSTLSAGAITLPGNLLGDDALQSGSALSVWPTDPDSDAGRTNHLAPVIWRTHLVRAARKGTDVIVFGTHRPADMAACRALSGCSRLRFEIVGQSQLDPHIISAMDQLGAFIRTRAPDGVGGVLGPADYLRTTRYLLRPDDPGRKVLPASAAEAKALWDNYRFARGEQRLRQVVDPGYTQSLTTVFLRNANYVDTARLMGAIRAYASEKLASEGIQVGFAGDAAVSQALIRGIVTTQLQSLLWSLLGILVVTAGFGGSLRWGFYCLAPSLLAVVIKFAILGWAGIPLGVATSMFAAMTLGIGVNCAIHLLESFAQARAAGAAPAPALSRALELTGPSALINTLAMSLGFGVLLLSQVPANVRLGMLLVLGLVNCFLVSLLILPVLLWSWRSPPRRSLRATEACQERSSKL